MNAISSSVPNGSIRKLLIHPLMFLNIFFPFFPGGEFSPNNRLRRLLPDGRPLLRSSAAAQNKFFLSDGFYAKGLGFGQFAAGIFSNDDKCGFLLTEPAAVPPFARIISSACFRLRLGNVPVTTMLIPRKGPSEFP